MLWATFSYWLSVNKQELSFVTALFLITSEAEINGWIEEDGIRFARQIELDVIRKAFQLNVEFAENTVRI